MLITNDHEKEIFEKMANLHEEKYGFKYLSPSSLSDFKDCSEKMMHRKNYKTVSLTALAGSVQHAINDNLGQKIMNIMLNNEVSFEQAREAALDRVDLEKTYDYTVKEYTETVPMDILSGELLAKDKDVPILKSKKKINEFFQGIKPILLDEANLKFFLDKPIILTEVPGYCIVCDHLLYGIVDRVSYDDGVFYVIDYKTIWSKTSKSNWDKLSHTFQGWVYKKYVENFLKSTNREYKEVKVVFKFLQIDLPKDYGKIDYDKMMTTTSTFEKEMVFDNLAEELYTQDLKTTATLLINGGGYIANSKYGCGYCSYKDFCKYYGGEE